MDSRARATAGQSPTTPRSTAGWYRVAICVANISRSTPWNSAMRPLSTPTASPMGSGLQHEGILHLVAQLDPRVLGLQVLVDGFHAVGAPEPARLVSAEGRVERKGAVDVDPHRARLEPPRHGVRAAQIPGPHARREPEAR